jgi:hypothetical protein
MIENNAKSINNKTINFENLNISDIFLVLFKNKIYIFKGRNEV